MNTLVALSYNNYYNRILRKEDSLAAYIANRDYKYIENINFNPAEGTETTQVINWEESFFPNYLLVLDEEQNIISRWFILKSDRTRGKQYKLSLRRDLLADFYNGLLSSDIFVEKANPLKADISSVFNNEGMQLNQIKKSETLLTDASHVPWIIGYVAKNYPMTGTITIDGKSNLDTIDIGTTFENWEFNKAYVDRTDNVKFITRFKALTFWRRQAEIDRNGALDIRNDVDSSLEAGRVPEGVPYDQYSNYVANYIFEYYRDSSLFNALESAATTKLSDRLTSEQIERLNSYNGKYLKDTNGEIRFFRISNEIHLISNETIDPTASSGPDSILSSNMILPINGTSMFTAKVPNSNSFALKTEYTRINLDLSSPITTAQTTLTWTNNPLKTEDAQYDLIAIPYGKVTIVDKTSTPQSFQTNKELSIAAATAIAKELGTNLYDLQLVPYFPIQELFYDGIVHPINTVYFKNNNQVSLITDSNSAKVGVVFHCPISNFTFDIVKTISIGSTQLDKKLSNECDMYRICSPNYSGLFEFSASKNNGVTKYNVDCTYKPYSPYIHVNPVFSGLYGEDFNDARGLVCAGDFSFGTVSDQWKQYEINNKNYRDIFDRQIQSMDLNNSIAREEAKFGAVAGSLTGGATGAIGGAMAGAKVGGPYGAAAGAIVGGISAGGASIAGGMLDLYHLEQRIMDARSLSIDMYGYNLGNIQALPYSLTKVSALTYNNKYFPFVEYYTCTDEEKEALRNKIKFNGATIMKIGKFESYTSEVSDNNMTRFFQGQLIRINDEELANQSANVISEINIELSKGVYL